MKQRGTAELGHSPTRLPSPLMTGDHILDREQFTQLLHQSDPNMRRLAWRLLRSQAAMDDALQDAYLKAFRNLDRFRGRPDDFRGWLYRIVYNTCLDHLRVAKRRRVEVDIEQQTAVADQRVAVGDGVVRRAELSRALSALPPDQIAALTLVDGEGYSYDEASLLLDVPRGTVASRVSRARDTIRNLFTDSEEASP